MIVVWVKYDTNILVVIFDIIDDRINLISLMNIVLLIFINFVLKIRYCSHNATKIIIVQIYSFFLKKTFLHLLSSILKCTSKTYFTCKSQAFLDNFTQTKVNKHPSFKCVTKGNIGWFDVKMNNFEKMHDSEVFNQIFL